MNNNFYQNNRGRENFKNNQQAPQNNNKREPLKLELEETLEFDGVLKSKISTTLDLCTTINELFKPIFVDYEGCVILPDSVGNLGLFLYFKDINRYPAEGQYKALQLLGQKKCNTTAMQRINNFNTRTRSKTYELTDDCKDLLSEFMPNNKGKINWNSFVVEQTQNEGSMYSIYVRVAGLDLNKIIGKLYGRKNKAGNPVEYCIQLKNPVGYAGMMNPQLQNNYMVIIQQLDTNEVRELCKSMGLYYSSGSLQIVR